MAGIGLQVGSIGFGDSISPLLSRFTYTIAISKLGSKVTVKVLGFFLTLDLSDNWEFQFYHILRKYGAYEPSCTSLILEYLKNGDTFIDAGANIGYFTVLASKVVGERGRVFSFEPFPSTMVKLVLNVRLNRLRNVRVIQKAVSDLSGNIPFYVSKNDVSLNNTIGNLGPKGDVILVESTTIDKEIPRGTQVKIAKLDVEGSELKAMEAMKRIIHESPELKVLVEYKSAYERARWCRLNRFVTQVDLSSLTSF